MKLIKKVLTCHGLMLLGVIGLGACAKVHPASHKDLSPVPALEPSSAPATEGPAAEGPEYMQPCDYWNSLKLTHAADEQVFQFVDQLHVVQESRYEQSFVGRFNLNRLPQLKYALSREFNKGAMPIDPPNLDGFMAKAKEADAHGELDHKKYLLLVGLYKIRKQIDKVGVDAIAFLLGKRNEAIASKTEELLPGIWSGEAKSLAKNPLMLDLLTSLRLPRDFPMNQMPKLFLPLQKAVPLFVSNNWSERRKDLEQSLSVLAKTASHDTITLKQGVCRFAIAQRYTAQLLTIKGIQGAPVTDQNGRLLSLPKQDEMQYPSEDIPGVFGAVVQEKWALDRLKKNDLDVDSVRSTKDFLSIYRYFITEVSNQSPNLWALPQELPQKGKLKLDAKLLKMNLGLFGILSQILSTRQLKVAADHSISLKDDDDQNFADTIYVTMEIGEAFKDLHVPNNPVVDYLCPTVLDKLKFLAPDGLIASVNQLQTGLILEGLERMRENRPAYTRATRDALRALGKKINNDRLKNL